MTNGTSPVNDPRNTRISVVIPVRNRAHVIARAIDSAVRQTLAPAEVIVVDDGSTDGTLAAARAVVAPEGIDLRIIAVGESVGAPEARNTGARAATGAFLAFLDSDDAWRRDKLRLQMSVFEDHPETIAVFSGVAYHRGDRIRVREIATDVIPLRDLMAHNLIGPTSTCLVRTDAFEAVGGFRRDLPSCQDWELWLRLAQHGPLRMVREPLLDYHYDGTGQISSNPAKVIAGHRMVFELVYQIVGDDPRALRRLRADHEMALARLCAMTFRDAPATFRHIGRALSTETAPDLLLQAGHYGLRSIVNQVRVALSGPRR
jgi:glycosyltransferase involved in cell wall biosynthesis